MEPESPKLTTTSESHLERADAHGLRHDEAGKSFDDVARDNFQTGDGNREILTPEARGDVLSATHKAAASATYARALLIEAAIERRGGDLDLYVDPVQVRDPFRLIVPVRQRPEAMGEWEDVTLVPFAAPEEPAQQHDARTTDRGYWP